MTVIQQVFVVGLRARPYVLASALLIEFLRGPHYNIDCSYVHDVSHAAAAG